MEIGMAAKEYLIEIEVRKYTPKTIRSYRNNLNLFLRFCEEEAKISEIEDVSLAVVRRFSLYLSGKGKKGSYINGLLKVAKAFIQYCYEEGYGGFNTKKNFKWCKQDKAVIMAFDPADVRSMLQSCRGYDFLHVRDKAILTILFETGIRCWELCCIQKSDIHEDFIIIQGKNHKQRVVPITPILRKALTKYDAVTEEYFTLKNREDYYFLSVHGRQLTNSAVEHIVKRYGEGIEGIRTSPPYLQAFFRATANQDGNRPLYDFTTFGSREYPNHPDLFEQLAGQGCYRNSQKQERFDVTGIRISKKLKPHKHQ